MQIRDEFQVHRLNAHGLETAEAIAETFSECLDRLERLCGAEGREMAIVRTKLQEANFFAKRAVAVDPTFQAE